MAKAIIVLVGLHCTQHDSIQLNDIQHNNTLHADIQHNNICNTTLSITALDTECGYPEFRFVEFH
jgi:hypothetical protein